MTRIYKLSRFSRKVVFLRCSRPSRGDEQLFVACVFRCRVLPFGAQPSLLRWT